MGQQRTSAVHRVETLLISCAVLSADLKGRSIEDHAALLTPQTRGSGWHNAVTFLRLTSSRSSDVSDDGPRTSPLSRWTVVRGRERAM